MSNHVGPDMRIFTGNSHRVLGEKICKYLGIEPGKIIFNRFSCGEIYAKIDESIRGYNVFVIQTCGTYAINEDLMELFIILDAIKRASAATINVIMPYYGYARQDKKSAPREPISARLVADLLQTCGIDRIITIDLHADQIQGYFNVPVDHMTALPLFADYFKNKNLADATVVAPDTGRAKAAKKLADRIGADLAIVHKTRPKHNDVEVMNIIGNVENRTLILFDDIIDTGRSVAQGAKALRKVNTHGDIYLAATHAVFSKPAYTTLKDSAFKEIVVTDTIPISDEHGLSNLSILSTAPLLAEAINRNHKHLSISELFDDDGIPVKRAPGSRTEKKTEELNLTRQTVHV
jgi:ribose-phosphate pyrophosphokinase